MAESIVGREVPVKLLLVEDDKKLATAVKRGLEAEGYTVEVALTAREHDVLEFLVRRVGQVLSKDEILAGVWDMDFEGDPNIIEVYIGRLRRKLGMASGGASPIETVRGAGYRLADNDG